MAQLALEEEQLGIIGAADVPGLADGPRFGYLTQAAIT
jgi:hypothetical protein